MPAKINAHKVESSNITTSFLNIMIDKNIGEGGC